MKRNFELLELRKNFTLDQIAETTGIQRTRVFRISHGKEMKLSEYKLIKAMYESEQPNENIELTHLTQECIQRLPVKTLKQIVDDLKSTLQIYKYQY